MKAWALRLALSVQFYTRIPLPVKTLYNDEETAWALLLSPAVGLLLGILLTLLSVVLYQLRLVNGVTAVLIFFTYVALTGGLHIDGLADTCDGFFSGRSRERMLEIMRDSRIGAFGVLGIVMLSLLQVFALSDIVARGSSLAVLLFPVVGRLCAVISAAFGQPARADGMGKAVILLTTPLRALCVFIPVAILLFLFLGFKALILLAITACVSFVITAYSERKIGGITGDVLGFSVELCQAVFCISYLICI